MLVSSAEALSLKTYSRIRTKTMLRKGCKKNKAMSSFLAMKEIQ